MKIFSVVVCCLALSGLANAQTLADGQQAGLDQRRASLSEERARLEAGFALEDAACRDRFALNSCLEKVNAKRRVVMAELRRQEISLNDEERKNRTQAQLRKIEEKSSPESLQDAAQQRAKAAHAYRLRVERDKSKLVERASSPSSEKIGRDAGSKKWITQKKKAQAQTARELAAAEEAQKATERQKKAQARIARNAASQLNHHPGKPLPLPASPP